MGAVWLIKNVKVIASLVLVFGVGVASYQLKAKLCALQMAEIERAFASAVTAANEKHGLAAEKLQRQTRTINTFRSEINRRVLDASDSSFGCVVDANGMSILADAKHTANTQRGSD